MHTLQVPHSKGAQMPIVAILHAVSDVVQAAL